MTNQLIKTLVGCGAVLGLASGCAPAKVSGSIGDLDFGKIKTAFYDVYEDDYFGYVIISLYDYKWSCEEIQTAIKNDQELWPEDTDEVVASLSILLTVWDGENYAFTPASSEGTYKAFDIYDVSDYSSIENGDLLSYVAVGFGNESETVQEYDTAEVGSVEVEKLDLDKGKVGGTFDVTLSGSASEFSGKFDVERCQVYDL